MEDIDDDFGELYADIEVHTSSVINGVPNFYQLQKNQQQQQHCNEVGVLEKRDTDSGIGEGEMTEKNTELGINGVTELGMENDSDSDTDDDFDLVVNDEDIGPIKGNGDGRRCTEEAAEDTEAEFVAGVSEGNLPGNKPMQVDGDGTKLSSGGCGGEIGNVGKNCCNSQHTYLRKYGSVYTGNQQAVSSWKFNREDACYGQNAMSRFVHGFAGNGNNFWLPWYRTIVDVDIDTFEEKSWRRPGDDITDYFNFGFDEESWRRFCCSLDQLRHQTVSQIRNKFNKSLKLEADAGATKELGSERFADIESTLGGLRKITSHESDFATKQLKKQIGQAIHVEDNNTERKPSMDGRRSRNRDSDVVIQITVQDSEEPSSSGNKEPDNTLGTQRKLSEKGFGHGIVDLKDEKPDGSKAYEMIKNSEEENFRSSIVSSDCKRSDESAAVSSQLLQDFYDQGKHQNSLLDIQPSEEADIISGKNLRAIKILNSSIEDVDNGSDTAGSNPCVAGINLSYDDHRCSSLSPSNSSTWSEALKEDYCDSRRNCNLRRSPAYSKKERRQVAKADYCHLRNRREDKRLKESDGRYHVGARNFIKEDLQHNEWRARRHLKWKSHSSEDNNYLIDTAEHSYGLHRLSVHHRGSEWCLTSVSDDEYWPSYRDNESSFGFYDRRSVENRFQAKQKKDFDRLDHWGSRDETDQNFQRELDEENHFSDRRMQIMRGETVQNDDWHLQERERSIREEKPFFRNQHQLMLKFSSSHDTNWLKRRREYGDVHFDKRSNHGRLLQSRNFDGSAHKEYSRSNPLDDSYSHYLDLENRHEKHIWYSGLEVGASGRDNKHKRHLWYSGVEVGASGRENECFDSPFDVDYPRYTVDDIDEYWNGKSSPSTHDYRDEFSTHDKRRHQITLYRDDMDDPQLYMRHGRHSRSFSAKKGTGSSQDYDHRDAYNRLDAAKYLDDDDYFEDRTTFQSKGLTWAEDTLFNGCSDDDFSNENMLDSFNDVPKRNWNGARHRFVPGGMTMHTQTMKNRLGVANDGRKSYFKSSTRDIHEDNGLWARNSVKVHNPVREKKFTGKFSNAGSLPNDDACKQADGRFRKQFKKQQKGNEAFPDKKMVKNGLNTKALQDKLPITNHVNAADLEEGQIPAEEPETEFVRVKKHGPGPVHSAQKVPMKERLFHSQKPLNQNGAYDENRILESKAKMEKRMERFKKPILVKMDTDSYPKPETDSLAEAAESKGLRPARKRKWGGN